MLCDPRLELARALDPLKRSWLPLNAPRLLLPDGREKSRLPPVRVAIELLGRFA
jgi:hypothetical protein